MRFRPAGLLLLFFCACREAVPPPKTGPELARIHCGACHQAPDPALLDSATWKNAVLPAMAAQLGIDYLEGAAYSRDSHPAVDAAGWDSIVRYYLRASPKKMPPMDRPPATDTTRLFGEKAVDVGDSTFPATSFLRIDPGNQRLYAASIADSSLAVYDRDLRLIQKTPLHAAVVDLDFSDSLLAPGSRHGVLTDIGIMNPNDLKTGSISLFDLSPDGRFRQSEKIDDSVRRPVFSRACDLDGDGRTDFLVCAFGNTYGSLYWLRGLGGNRFERHVLRDLPGAIRAEIGDFDGDGKPDVIALMAQAQEGIFLFHNEGGGRFRTEQLLSFPPVYGSSYFELDDFNGDGRPDILYTCGDNADLSTGVLKPYHGIYLFLNEGANHFRLAWFFPMYGCYKAVARDFDHDGDLDIAAISFFPDRKGRPQESFLYLEKRPDGFKPWTIAGFNRGNWLTMDVGDLDGDGFDDIVLGSLIPPYHGVVQRWHDSRQKRSTVLLLHNEAGQPAKGVPAHVPMRPAGR